MRKGVADMGPRAEISRRINASYMDHVAAATEHDTTLQDQLTPYMRARTKDGRRVRALQPMGKDQHLVNIIADPQFLVAGFDNKAIRGRLREHGRYRGKTDKQLAGIVTRAIRLLRDHGIIHKVPSRRRYRISKAGLSLAHAVTAALSSSTKELTKKAA